MRCFAETSSKQMRGLRASGDSDPRCQRIGHVKIAGKMFCYQHAPRIREDHERILAAIRAIPCR